MEVCLENDDAAVRAQPVGDSEVVKGTPLCGRAHAACEGVELGGGEDHSAPSGARVGSGAHPV